MERRFAVFLILTVLVWTGFLVMRTYLLPPQQVARQVPGERPPVHEGGDDAGANEAPATTEPAVKPESEPVQPPALARPAVPSVPQQYLTLGSADPESGYSGLYYFDNHGAALECAELNGRKYKSIDDFSGYLGRLNLSDAVGGGAEINVVGAGTPAAMVKATGAKVVGLVVGDIIQSIDDHPINDAKSLETYLREKTRPRQRIKLSVVRKGAAAPLEFSPVLVRRPLAIVQPERHQYTLAGRQISLPHDPLSLLLTLEVRPDDRDGSGLQFFYDANWKVEQQGEDFVEFSLAVDQQALAEAKASNLGPVKIVKRFSLAKSEKGGTPPFALNLQVRIENVGDQLRRIAYRLDGPTGLPLEGWWYSTKLNPNWGGAGARDVVWKQPDMGHQLIGCPRIVSDARQALKKNETPQSRLLVGEKASPLDYAGVDTQFFAGVILPQTDASGQTIRFRSAFARPVQDVEAIPKTRLRTANVSVRLTTSPVELEPGATLQHDYRVFFGPKDPQILSVYHLEQLIEFGWPIFAVPAKLLRGVLNGLFWLTGLVGIPNYGIAIVLLTVIVRSCMIPVSLKQARSAAKMQELAPEIQKIKDKYPDDPMKQHTAVQELYKKHNFNMFGGCLPVFIQLPVFIGLYRCLSVDIDLRDAALFSESIQWASNLAGPDKLFHWAGWMPSFIADEADGWLGPFFNVFPLITVTLFLIQQKLFTPPATDEQTKMQQQMMNYMTVFMGVMFYKVPAGLCLYFITSSLWGICERKLLPKSQPKAGLAGESRGESASWLTAKPPGTNGAGRSGSSKRPKQKR